MTLFSPFLSAQHAAIAVCRRHPVLGGAALVASVLIAVLGAFLIGPFNSRAVQAPVMSLDMVPGGNTYDDTTNTMTVNFNPEADFCLASASANPATHIHQSHLIIQNVEDLIGWQVRLNYDGGKMRPLNQNVTPFLDNNTAQGLGFTNLPIDQVSSVHRDVIAAASIPPQAPGPQTALLGGVYAGDQYEAVSPDTPAKAIPDDTSYSAPNGGVLSQISLQVVGDQTGQTLFMDLDDDSPNPPGSALVVFSGTGTTLALAETDLSDGAHAEGAACPGITPRPTPPPTPTATPAPTPTPTGGGATPTPTPPGGGGGPFACKCFKPELSATYCRSGSGDIDEQAMSVRCDPDASPGTRPDIVGRLGLGLGPDGQPGTPDDTNDYYLGGSVALSPSAPPDDFSIPIGAILGRLGSQPTQGLVNNGCGNHQLRIPFTLMKGTTDINDTVQPQPFGTSNDLAIMAGDNPPYNGVQDVKPAPALTKYPSFLNAIFDPDWVDFGPDRIAGNGDDNNGPQSPIKPLFRAVGVTAIAPAGNLWTIFQVLVFDKGTQLPGLPAFDPAYGYPEVSVLQQSSGARSATPRAPNAITDTCSPQKEVSVSYGLTHDNPDTPANEGGIPLRTMPAAGTSITGIAYYTSQRDADGDGYENALDPCPFTPDTVWNPRDVNPPIEGDSDIFAGVPSPDGIPDSCDPTPNEATASPPANSPVDHDGDGFINRGDNCPLVANPDQRDTDSDGIGDACDPNPNTPDGPEIVCIKAGTITSGGDPNVAFTPCLTSLPSLDNDNDGVNDANDACPATPLAERPVDSNGCSQHQVDADLDGICDPGKTSTLCSGSDNCPAKPNPSQTDSDGDGLGDACDTTGHGTIPANAATVTVPFSPINPASSVVLITPLGDPGDNLLWVSLENNQFTVHVRSLQGSNRTQRHPPIQFMYEVSP